MKTLMGVVFLKTVVVLWVILYGGIGLSPDEAQYWTWSQELAPGYYSKPPGIAYQIFLGSSLFGHTELGVRFGSLLLGMALPFLIYRLARRSGLSEEGALWAGVIWALCPIGLIGSLLAITDGGMILFWVLALIVLLNQGPGVLLGLTVAAGALFKWPIYLIWVFVFFYQWKKWDRRLVGAFLISLLGLLPSVIWNYQNDFATFRHVGATLQGGSGAQTAKGNFWEFLGAQILLLSPVFFALMLLAYKKWKDRALRLALIITAPLFLAGMTLALFIKVQGNWATMAFPTAAVLAAAAGIERKKWLYIGTALTLVLTVAAFLLVPLKHNRGWDKLSGVLTEAGYDPARHFLVSDKYQNTSLLSFYGPGQKRAYFLNLRGDRLNQFSFWPSLKDRELNRDGFFLTLETSEPPLSPYFSQVEKVGTYPLTATQSATIYKLVNYNGLEPASPLKF